MADLTQAMLMNTIKEFKGLNTLQPKTVYEDINLMVMKQIRFPRSKKKRIKKKWKKNKQNSIAYPDPNCYVTSHAIFAHPETIKNLREQMATTIGDLNEQFLGQILSQPSQISS